MPGLKVGLASEILNARYSPTAVVRTNYLTAVASRVDSLWVPDHLNSLMPRAIATPQYLGAAKLIPKIDASLEPWRCSDTSPPATGSGGCDWASV
jgi:phthiodiolone/phenolphthiodiolone dimycocerosates ketoreductase